MKARARYLQARPFKRWYKQYQRESAYRVYLNEITEYVNTTTRPSGVAVPLARIRAWRKPRWDWGCWWRRSPTTRAGSRPRWRAWRARAGWTRPLRARLDEFFEDLADAHVVLHDVSPSNIAYGRNADGKPGLYLIDGFGSLPLIPLYAWSRRLNRRRVRQKYAEMLASMERRAREAADRSA